jgi:hypothetical protein
MNVNKSVSIKEVIAKILRITGYDLPSFYESDLYEWINDGLRLTETKFHLSTYSKDLIIQDHIGKLPCGYMRLVAVEYNGYRLPMGSDVTDIVNQSTKYHTKDYRKETKSSDINEDFNNLGINVGGYIQDDYSFSHGNFTANFPVSSTKDYYKLQLDYIHTSFPEGYVKLHYLAYPIDDEGYPLIPDNENLKQYLMWHTLSQLRMAGYSLKAAELNNFNTLSQYADKYMPLAISDMRALTVDGAERLYRNSSRLIFPEQRWREFGINSEVGERIDTHLDRINHRGI